MRNHQNVLGVCPSRFGETKTIGHRPRRSHTKRSGYQVQVMMANVTTTLQIKKSHCVKMCIGADVHAARAVFSAQIGRSGHATNAGTDRPKKAIRVRLFDSPVTPAHQIANLGIHRAA
jgi:hypothetical protein